MALAELSRRIETPKPQRVYIDTLGFSRIRANEKSVPVSPPERRETPNMPPSPLRAPEPVPETPAPVGPVEKPLVPQQPVPARK